MRLGQRLGGHQAQLGCRHVELPQRRTQRDGERRGLFARESTQSCCLSRGGRSIRHQEPQHAPLPQSSQAGRFRRIERDRGAHQMREQRRRTRLRLASLGRTFELEHDDSIGKRRLAVEQAGGFRNLARIMGQVMGVQPQGACTEASQRIARDIALRLDLAAGMVQRDQSSRPGAKGVRDATRRRSVGFDRSGRLAAGEPYEPCIHRGDAGQIMQHALVDLERPPRRRLAAPAREEAPAPQWPQRRQRVPMRLGEHLHGEIERRLGARDGPGRLRHCLVDEAAERAVELDAGAEQHHVALEGRQAEQLRQGIECRLEIVGTDGRCRLVTSDIPQLPRDAQA